MLTDRCWCCVPNWRGHNVLIDELAQVGYTHRQMQVQRTPLAQAGNAHRQVLVLRTLTGAADTYPTTSACAASRDGADEMYSSTGARVNLRHHVGSRNCVGHGGCWRGVFHHWRKSIAGHCWCAELRDWRRSKLVRGRRNSVSHCGSVLHDGRQNCSAGAGATDVSAARDSS